MPRSSTQKVCSPGCALKLVRSDNAKKAEKATKAVHKQYRKDKRDLDRSSLKWQHKKTQQVFNKLRRLEELKWFQDRGLEPECISCGKTNMDWCCGHFKTVGAQGALRYDRVNTYLQCNRYCNMGLSGNIEGNKTTRGYKQGLIDRFGADKAAEIIDYCETNTAIVKWEWRQLESMRGEFNAKIRELESLLNPT
jgi:Bacteriophage Lambda NinG protein